MHGDIVCEDEVQEILEELPEIIVESVRIQLAFFAGLRRSAADGGISVGWDDEERINRDGDH